MTANNLARGGGMERQARDLIEGLIERGIRPVVLARKLGDCSAWAGKAELVEVDSRLIPAKLRDWWFS
ncbi:MAG: glycosyl transferase family 1, partial [Planctomycetota bacterium]|nr:glycosyl transferase family 1 [Planctomycetota bacterium]